MGYEIRRPYEHELELVAALVKDVVGEKYGHLFNSRSVPPSVATDWKWSLAAFDQGELVAVGLSQKDWLDDLWVKSGHRRRGIGTALLRMLEAEISDAGHNFARLRFVAENKDAGDFYLARDWFEVDRYPHEIYGFEMVEMRKSISNSKTGLGT